MTYDPTALARADRAVTLARRKEQQAQAALTASLRDTAYAAMLQGVRPVSPALPPALTWEAAVAAEQARGLTRWQALQAAAKAHPALYAAQRGPRPGVPPRASRSSSADATAWHAAVQAKVAAGMRRSDAILAVAEEQPALYAAQRYPKHR